MADSEFRYCFTLDTEPDDLWEYGGAVLLDHMQRLSDFHDRLCAAGARPTYLTTSEVAEDGASRAVLERALAQGNCEVGAHFHTWTRDWPFEVPDLGQPRLHAMAHQLGQETEERMLAYTCDALRKAFGKDVTSYRGGRWSLGPRTPVSLANCGIVVDSTVTPGLSWRSSVDRLLDGPDFTESGCHPYYLKPSSNGRSVLEFPVGAAHVYPKQFPVRIRSSLGKRVIGRVMRWARQPFGHHWLRPTHTSVAQMKAVMELLRDQGVPVWVFMIHSSEVVPCTPLPTQDAVDAFWDRCAGAVRVAQELGARAATLTEAAEWYRTSQHG